MAANREIGAKLAEKLGLKTALGHICAKNRTKAELIAECLRLMAQQEWIKVSERVPENNDCILIWNGINVIFGRYEHFHGGSCFTYAEGGQILRPEY